MSPTTRAVLPASIILPAAIVLLALPACLHVPSGYAATPQRPTVSSDTSTTAEGTIELEAGGIAQPGEVYSFPVTLKWGMTADSELLASWAPWQRFDRPGGSVDGPSDVLLGVRQRFLATDDGTSAALQVTGKLPTADEARALGSGEVDFFAAGIVTQKVGDGSLTGFVQLGVLGEPDPAGSDLSIDGALAGGLPLGGSFTAFGEIAGLFVPEQDLDAVLCTVGAAFALDPGTVFDVGVQVGLTDDAPDYLIVFGITQNFGNPLRGGGTRER